MGQQRPGPAGLHPQRLSDPAGKIAGRNERQRQVTKPRHPAAQIGPPAASCLDVARSTVDRPALTTQLAVACLGAGVITSFAVAQGQNPFTALGITLFSAVAAVMVGQVL